MFLLEDVHVIEEDIDYLTNSDVFNDPLLFDKYHTIVIKSNTGTGKTTFAAKVLPKQMKGKVLSIVSRQTMAYQHQKSFGFTNYLDKVDFNRFESDYLVCSLEQLSLINDTTIFEYVFLDEFASLLSHIKSNTMKLYRRENWQTLCHIIINAQYIIACDATLNDACLYLLTILRDKNKMMFYHNTRKNKTNVIANIYINGLCSYNNITYQPSDHLILDKMYNDIKYGKRFTVASDCRRLLQKVYQDCIIFSMNYGFDLNDFVLFTSTEGNIHDIANINYKCKDKFIFYSPKIIYGVDITLEYDNSYAFFHGSSMNAFAMLQQLGRPRKAKHLHISIHNGSNYNNKYKSNTLTGVKQEIKQNVLRYKETSERCNTTYALKKDHDVLWDCGSVLYTVKGSIVSDDAIYSHVFYYNEYFNNYINVYKLEALQKFLQHQGFQQIIHHVSNDDVSDDMSLQQLNNDWYEVLHHSFSQERVDQIEHVIFQKKRKIAKDIYVQVDQRYDDIITNAIDICKVLKIPNLNVFNDNNSPFFQRIFKDPKGINKLFKSFLLLYQPSYLAKCMRTEQYTDLIVINANVKKDVKGAWFIHKIELILNIDRFNIDSVLTGTSYPQTVHDFFQSKKDEFITIFDWHKHKKSVFKLIDNRNYKELLCRAYKSYAKPIISRKRIRDNGIRYYIKLINYDYIRQLIEVKLRINTNDKDNIVHELYKDVSVNSLVRFNDIYHTTYVKIIQI